MRRATALVRRAATATRALACAAAWGAACLATAPPIRAQSRVQRPEPLPRRGAIVSAELQPEVVTIGQPFTVRLRVRAARIATIRFPPLPDSGDAIEAIDPRSVEDAGDADMLDRTAVYRFVAWNVGTRTPAFGDVVVTFAGVDQRFPVAIGPVYVRSLLPADSVLRVPKEAREPMPAPGTAWRYWLLLGVLASGLAWYWLRRRTRRGSLPGEPEAWVAATTAFGALERLALVEAGEPGRHLIAHVDVVRAYVARRFPVAGEALSPRELVTAIADVAFPIPPERVGELLERDAAVRYAGAFIEPETALALGREARAIVRDVQAAYEARLEAIERGPARARGGSRR